MHGIRPATLDDVGLVARLDRLCFPSSWSLEVVRSVLASAACSGFLIDDRAYAIWSTVEIGRQELECELLRLGVHPAARNQGLARALVEHQIAALAAYRSRIFLEVRPSNVEAVGLYLGLGFVEVGRRPAYYEDGEDALLMRYCTSGQIVGPDG